MEYKRSKIIVKRTKIITEEMDFKTRQPSDEGNRRIKLQ
jgi:hypothetical protein